MVIKYIDTGNARIRVEDDLITAKTQGGTTDYGDHPENSIVPFVGDAGAADNDVLYTSGDVSNKNYHAIQNASAVAIDVHVTADGTFNASQAAQGVVLNNSLTGDDVTSLTIPANTTGYLLKKVKGIRVDQAAAGTIAAGAVTGFHGVA